MRAVCGNQMDVKTNHQRKVMRKRKMVADHNHSIKEKIGMLKTSRKTLGDLPLPQIDNVKKLPATTSYPPVASNSA
jgi:hypothetical protein